MQLWEELNVKKDKVVRIDWNGREWTEWKSRMDGERRLIIEIYQAGWIESRCILLLKHLQMPNQWLTSEYSKFCMIWISRSRSNDCSITIWPLGLVSAGCTSQVTCDVQPSWCCSARTWPGLGIHGVYIWCIICDIFVTGICAYVATSHAYDGEGWMQSALIILEVTVALFRMYLRVEAVQTSTMTQCIPARLRLLMNGSAVLIHALTRTEPFNALSCLTMLLRAH